MYGFDTINVDRNSTNTSNTGAFLDALVVDCWVSRIILHTLQCSVALVCVAAVAIAAVACTVSVTPGARC